MQGNGTVSSITTQDVTATALALARRMENGDLEGAAHAAQTLHRQARSLGGQIWQEMERRAEAPT